MGAFKTIISTLLVFATLQVSFAQKTVADIQTPEGFTRIEASGFAQYLQALPLRPKGTPVRLYNGHRKIWQGGAYRVVDMEIGTKDLQQCADAVIRLRAEYLWHNRKFSDIHFNFTSGFRADYLKWAQGYRISVSGNNVEWVKKALEDYSYASFRKYLDVVFMYAGSASLSRELASCDKMDIRPGDVFIKGGHPGHAMIVLDVAVDRQGRKAILVAQSYMPAQDIHIVTNRSDTKHSPWYIFDSGTEEFNFPEWSFSADQIKRFNMTD